MNSNSQLIRSNRVGKSVYVISEHLMFSHGLESLLRQLSPPVEIIGHEDNLDRAIQQVKSLQPDIIILYTHNPLTTGASLARQILESNLRVNLISMSVDDNKMYSYQFSQRMVKGPEDLISAIHHDFSTTLSPTDAAAQG